MGILKNPASNSSMDFDFVIPQDIKRYFLSGVDFLVLNKNFNKTDFENITYPKYLGPKSKVLVIFTEKIGCLSFKKVGKMAFFGCSEFQWTKFT